MEALLRKRSSEPGKDAERIVTALQMCCLVPRNCSGPRPHPSKGLRLCLLLLGALRYFCLLVIKFPLFKLIGWNSVLKRKQSRRQITLPVSTRPTYLSFLVPKWPFLHVTVSWLVSQWLGSFPECYAFWQSLFPSAYEAEGVPSSELSLHCCWIPLQLQCRPPRGGASVFPQLCLHGFSFIHCGLCNGTLELFHWYF